MRLHGTRPFVLLVMASSCVGPREVPPRQGLPAWRAPTGSVTLRIVVAEGAAARKPSALAALSKKYRGRVERVSEKGVPVILNTIGIEEYIAGVLPGEVIPSIHGEALMAMAVVARTYAWHRYQTRGADAVHMYADTRDQAYCGRSCEDSRCTQAVQATAGLVLAYDGRALPSYFHACCAGHTEDVREVWGGGPVGPLAGVACRWCRSSKHYGPWKATVEGRSLVKSLGWPVESVKALQKNASGRVKDVEVRGSGERTVLSAARFRSYVGSDVLRSTRFEAAGRRGRLEITGYGWGHGVGLCQEGARSQASEGRRWREIITWYFPGAELKRLGS